MNSNNGFAFCLDNLNIDIELQYRYSISIEKKKEGMCHVDLCMWKNVVIRKRHMKEVQMCFYLCTYYLGSITLSVCGEGMGFHSFPYTNHGTTLR